MTLWKTNKQVDAFLNGVRAILPLAEEQITVMMTLIRATGLQVNHFLDLGCGDGILGRTIFDEFPAARGTFIDFSEPMLAAAKIQLANRQATIMQHDLCDLAWVQHIQAPVEVVVSGYAIHHLPDACKQALYRQIYDLLAPGGIFLNMEHVSSPSPWVEQLFEQSIIDGIYLRSQQKGDPKTRPEIEHEILNAPEDGDICASVEDQCAWLREIGFVNVDCYMKIYALALFGGMKASS